MSTSPPRNTAKWVLSLLITAFLAMLLVAFYFYWMEGYNFFQAVVYLTAVLVILKRLFDKVV
ncbi:MAG: hypothetical protein LBP68_07745 [Acidobacteriota bacterium]|jgi:hypothetical protein|nr:hypothetical protein [Acidobacteriota bacterium]